ncbi:hypothetical protein PSACC_01713 [Paramicrosporidium saccamoebae]|uniref:Protein kinase domain-containing protein n=1 Tax=Paramicrosporidium saccamoebae TaxID=1246581 RepID=A0A2H9TL60_9FUNG|nr:hypothetical protein PSACC_01713 [Paramicrosporidium saccamoebae]
MPLMIFAVLLCLGAICNAAKHIAYGHKIPILTKGLLDKRHRYRPRFIMYMGKICTSWDFKNLREIGGDSTNSVYLAEHISGELVVVKKFSRDARPEGIRMEEVVLNMLHHPGLPTGICAFNHAKDAVSVVMKYYEGVNMADWLKTREGVVEANLQKIVIQLVDVLLFLHDHAIIHNNIVLENIIIGRELQVRLIGFEFTRYAPDGMNLELGDIYNMAPEKLAGSTFHNGVDWYGLGLVIYQATNKHHPFHGARSMGELKRIRPGRTMVSVQWRRLAD